MEKAIHINTPLTEDFTRQLKMGQQVFITGVLYTARDAAHQRMVTAATAKEPYPFDMKGAIIYYVGPTPPKPGMAIGSAGPTSSYRMDPYTIELLTGGLKGMIGKGPRSDEVKKALQTYHAVYFAATGGVGALISKSIKQSEVIAYDDLGTEAIRRLEVVNFPAIVAIDAFGNDIYVAGRKQFSL
jgi:fumarate hydratase subunit beta